MGYFCFCTLPPLFLFFMQANYSRLIATKATTIGFCSCQTVSQIAKKYHRAKSFFYLVLCKLKINLKEKNSFLFSFFFFRKVSSEELMLKCLRLVHIFGRRETKSETNKNTKLATKKFGIKVFLRVSINFTFHLTIFRKLFYFYFLLL
jgi:hypothetical protein